MPAEKTAAALGARYAVFVANQKNCQGISLWQSESNPRSMKQSPYRQGTFDCVGEFIKSCKKYNILPGLYYQTGFNGHYYNRERYRMPGTKEHESYVRIVEGDLVELWSRYGQLFEIWFDGGVVSRQDGGADVAGLLELYQPQAVCFQGPREHGQNLRWIGNEDGKAPFNTWSTADQKVCHFDGTSRDTQIGAGVPGGKYWFPAETDMGNRRPEAAGAGWGWAPGEEQLAWTPEELLERYYTSVGRNSNFLLGQCIADDGSFPDTQQFRALGNDIRRIYAKPLNRTRGEGTSFVLTMPENAVIKNIAVMEDIAGGERIREFRITAKTHGGERELLHAGCVGHKRLIPTGNLRAEEIGLLSFKVKENQISGILPFTDKNYVLKGECNVKKKKNAVRAVLPKKQPFRAYMKGHYDLYLLLLPAVLYVAIFMYVPMYGVLMAFQDYSPAKGILGSSFVGLKHFEKFFSTYMAKQIITNTVVLSAYSLIVSFPFPVILALMLNYCMNKKFGKLVQTVTYMPYFISVMVLVGMMNIFFSSNYGVVNMVLKALGREAYTFMSSEASFRHMYVWSGIWQGMGYSSVIYFAALAGIDPTLYEAAELDGASKLQRILYIDLPSIMPTVIIMLIMSAGNLMSVGFEKAYLMQNDRNSGVSEILSTYVYKVGLIDARYSFSAAINLFNSVINFVILITINKISGKLSETSLW